MRCIVGVVDLLFVFEVVCSLSVKGNEDRREKLEAKKKSLLGFGHKFSELGGTKVIIA